MLLRRALQNDPCCILFASHHHRFAFTLSLQPPLVGPLSRPVPIGSQHASVTESLHSPLSPLTAVLSVISASMADVPGTVHVSACCSMELAEAHTNMPMHTCTCTALDAGAHPFTCIPFNADAHPFMHILTLHIPTLHNPKSASLHACLHRQYTPLLQATVAVCNTCSAARPGQAVAPSEAERQVSAHLEKAAPALYGPVAASAAAAKAEESA